MKSIVYFLSVLCLVLPAMSQEIVATPQKTNPTIRIISDPSVTAELSKGIVNNLKNCGWFQITDAPSANYTLTLKGLDAGKISVVISDTSGAVINKGSYTHDTSPLKGNWKQHRIVDEVISRVYTVNNKICASRIAFCGSKGGVKEIYTVDFSGGDLNKETNYKSLAVEPAWSADNRYLSYTVYGSQNANLIQKDLSTNQHRVLSKFKGLNSGAAFHPTGDKIVLTLSKDNNVDLFVMQVGNTTATLPLTRDTNIESSPTWSTDGNKIIYVSASVDAKGKIGVPKLYLMDLSRKVSQPIYRDGVERVSPDWSNNAGTLVYSKRVGGQYVLAVCNPANPSTEKILTSDAGNWEAPSWAPDGRHIICTRSSGKNSELWIVDSVLGNKREIKISQNGSAYFDSITLPSWSSIF